MYKEGTSPGIVSKESPPPAYVVCVPVRRIYSYCTSFLAPIDCSKIPAQYAYCLFSGYPSDSVRLRQNTNIVQGRELPYVCDEGEFSSCHPPPLPIHIERQITRMIYGLQIQNPGGGGRGSRTPTGAGVRKEGRGRKGESG